MNAVEALAFLLVYGVVVNGIEPEPEWGDVRLMDGITPLDGRPEVYISRWRPICDKDLTPNVAKTICRQLGYPPTNVTLKTVKFKTNQNVFLECNGDEENLLQECHWARWSKDNCSADEALGLTCNGNLRFEQHNYDAFVELMYQSSTAEIIEVYRDGEWMHLCDNDPDPRLAEVICRQMGIEGNRVVLVARSFFSSALKPIAKYHVTCTGHETSHEQCVYSNVSDSENCNSYIGVSCNETVDNDVQLLNEDGISSNQGRIRFPNFYRTGYWCGSLSAIDEKEKADIENIASVICNQLGFSRYKPTLLEFELEEEQNVSAGVPAFPYMCSGREDRLDQCIHIYTYFNDLSAKCNLSEIGIECKAAIRLENGTSVYNGRIELRDNTNGVWYPIADTNKDHAIAKVICRELGFQSTNASLRLASFFGVSAQAPRWHRFICSGEEENLKDCEIEYEKGNSTDSLGVDCDAPYIEVWLDANETSTEGSVLVNDEGAAFYACADGLQDDDNRIASVLCHQLGNSRFNAHISFVAARFEYRLYLTLASLSCVGTEEHVGECSRRQSELVLPCDQELILSCQDVRSCSSSNVYEEKWGIQCYDQLCLRSSNCRDALVFCSLENGGSCVLEENASPSHWEKILTCQENCRSEFVRDAQRHRSTECCYSSLCNGKTVETRDKQDIRLDGGIAQTDGNVQVFYSGVWHYIKQDGVDESLIQVLCRNAGYFGSNVAKEPNIDRVGTVTCIQGLKKCDRLNDTIQLCGGTTATCNGDILRVNCHVRSPPIRLVASSSPSMGRVEVFRNDTWGTICNHGFSKEAGGVLCRALGYPSGCSEATATESGILRFRSGEGTIHFTNLECNGNEKNILYCNYSTYDVTSGCSHKDDVGIVCEDGHLDNDVTMTTLPMTTTPPTPRRRPVDMLCYEGTCDEDCVTPSRGYPECTTSTEAFCYIERRATTHGNLFNFGCTDTCTNGTTQKPYPALEKIQVKYCCSSARCNLDQMILDLVTDLSNVGSLLFDDVAGNITDNVDNNIANESIVVILQFAIALFMNIY